MYGFNYVNGTYTSRGSIVTDTTAPDGAGKVFRSTLSGATQGYRAHTELRLVDADFPRKRAVYEHSFRFTTMGSLLSNDDAKVGFGLVGAPAGAANQDGFATGGTNFPDSWTERMTVCRPGYVSSSDPGGLSAYVYADYAGGKTYSSFGLRFPYRQIGQAVIPVEGRWYKRRVEVVTNTPGANDGVYRVWVDGVLALELTDVRWNPTGQDIPVGYLMTQTFPNATLTTPAVFDQTLTVTIS